MKIFNNDIFSNPLNNDNGRMIVTLKSKLICIAM